MIYYNKFTIFQVFDMLLEIIRCKISLYGILNLFLNLQQNLTQFCLHLIEIFI
jgi:hypothetical protein